MRQMIGTALQFLCLVFLPLVVIFSINFGFPLVVMPVSILIAILVFTVGHGLRSS